PVAALAKGTTVFRSNRTSKFGLGWGSYNTTCLDPTDPNIFWTYQEYATSSVPSQYTTLLGRVPIEVNAVGGIDRGVSVLRAGDLACASVASTELSGVGELSPAARALTVVSVDQGPGTRSA